MDEPARIRRVLRFREALDLEAANVLNRRTPKDRMDGPNDAEQNEPL
jgi:hypothetical protein